MAELEEAAGGEAAALIKEEAVLSELEGDLGGSAPRQRVKRTSLACIRCRTRHIKCPGGNPCKKCQMAQTKCEYIEADRKIVVSMKYLSKLHDDIARLKKDNATLRNNLKKEADLNKLSNTAADKDILGGGSRPSLVRDSSVSLLHRGDSTSLDSSASNGSGYDSGRSPNAFTNNLRYYPQTYYQGNQQLHSQVLHPHALQLQLQYSQVKDEMAQEVIQPSLDKHGRLIQSRTGEKLYAGSSSMTLFGLEIQNMVLQSSLSSPTTSPIESNNMITTNNNKMSPSSIQQMISQQQSIPLNKLVKSESQSSTNRGSKRETEILEKEGNAYKITLAKTNTRPGLLINFTLPSYSYAMLLVDTFINYNDGCFYFFNEGLVKRFLMNLYSGKSHENKKILKRNHTNVARNEGNADIDENTIKKDADDDTILETIWFCKILLIFAIGEMYLGTESDIHIKKLKIIDKLAYASTKNKSNTTNKDPQFISNMDMMTENEETIKEKKNTLPGSGFFFQASELFTGLFASGAIDNSTKDGGIEAMLLYAFYLQVADCTIASYFYFGLALRSTLILGWHVDSEKDNLNRFELEHRRRIWWTVYMYERMLLSKAGLPLSFADDSVSTELPVDFDMSLDDCPRDDNDIRGFYIFPSAEYINNCVTITQINAIILSSLYTKQPTVNILPVVSDLVHKLMQWKNALPPFLKVDYLQENLKVSRLIVNLMTEYFQGMNLAVRPLLFHFATKKLKDLQTSMALNKYVDLTKYSKNVLTLLNASFQASINTIKSIWALVPENMVALFGWMDREYLFTSASTLILFNTSFGVHEATKEHLDHALIIFTRMKELGNYPAALRRAQLLKLIRVLDFNGVMSDLLQKHDDEEEEGEYSEQVTGERSNMINNPLIDTAREFEDLNPINHPLRSRDRDHGRDQTLPPADNSSTMTTTTVRNDKEKFSFIDFEKSVPEDYYTQATGPTTFNFDDNGDMVVDGTGDDIYNSDLAGIEGVMYLDDEQKLWHDITTEAVWLNTNNPTQPPSRDLSHTDFFKNSFNPREKYPSLLKSRNQSPLNETGPGTGPVTGSVTGTKSSSQEDNQQYQNIYEGLMDSLSNNTGYHPVHNGFSHNVTAGGYSDIINQEFQDMMEG
ncbi:Transcriptional activator [Scheffersomyces spartinae]|uniref:Transcriptional activator n=1 Tax=Scheffersomyces spartinae TaxID=45513 RepID=A0A9P7V7U7_9ASCO|nr:Transcriptional activator [Scheffersomyces spartinae]KAG7192501.1 Transcriptional activator [Scheffersomyces spartinae]